MQKLNVDSSLFFLLLKFNETLLKIFLWEMLSGFSEILFKIWDWNEKKFGKYKVLDIWAKFSPAISHNWSFIVSVGDHWITFRPKSTEK